MQYTPEKENRPNLPALNGLNQRRVFPVWADKPALSAMAENAIVTVVYGRAAR
jgi:hypothetical protein